MGLKFILISILHFSLFMANGVGGLGADCVSKLSDHDHLALNSDSSSQSSALCDHSVNLNHDCHLGHGKIFVISPQLKMAGLLLFDSLELLNGKVLKSSAFLGGMLRPPISSLL